MWPHDTAYCAVGLFLTASISIAGVARLLSFPRRLQMSLLGKWVWCLGVVVSVPTALVLAAATYSGITREVRFRGTEDAKQCAQSATETDEVGSAPVRWRYEACLDEMRALR